MTPRRSATRWHSTLAWIPRGLVLGALAFAIFGPIANLALWAVAERWYFPYKLPVSYGLRFWYQVFRPSSDALATLGTSVSIALFCVVVCLVLAIPAGFALARGRLPWRGAILLAFLLPQAFPSIAVYFNVARIFYTVGLNGTIPGVVLVHATHGLVFAVWISAAAFAAVDPDLELAARNIGASRLRAFLTVTLPLAAPGIMASAIFVFLESLDEFTGTYFVGVPDVLTLPLLMFNASIGGNYQIAAITALILLVPSVGFMLFIERFLKADVLGKIGG
jgi:ABC-type spermidine/putrescine transport system permease subunit II